MSKHKHAEIGKAKLDNMELVVFYHDSSLRRGKAIWHERRNKAKTNFNPKIDYFLCLPQHKETCLHWLDGGEVGYRYENHPGWCLFTGDRDREWSEESIFMRQDIEIRIKPRKEKRWIAVNVGNEQRLGGRTVTVCSHAYHNKGDAEAHGWQVIEIEVTK